MNLGSTENLESSEKNSWVFLSPETLRIVISYFTTSEIETYTKDTILCESAKQYLEIKNQEHKTTSQKYQTLLLSQDVRLENAKTNDLLQQYHSNNKLDLFKALLFNVEVCQKFNFSFYHNSCHHNGEQHWIFKTAKVEFIDALLESPAAEQAVVVDTSHSHNHKQQKRYLNFLHFAFYYSFNTEQPVYIRNFLLKSTNAPALVAQKSPSGNSVLHLLVKNSENLKIILDEFGWLIDQRGAHGKTALYLCVSQGYLSSFQLLVNRKADVTLATTTKDNSIPENDTIFHAAFRLKPSATAKSIQANLVALLEANSSVRAKMLNCVNSHGDTPLIVAFNNGYVEWSLELFRLGAILNYNIPHMGNTSRLEVALEKYDVELIKLIVLRKNVTLTPKEQVRFQETVKCAAKKCDLNFLNLLLREHSKILTQSTLEAIQTSLEKFKGTSKDRGILENLEITLGTIRKQLGIITTLSGSDPRMRIKDHFPPGHKPFVAAPDAQRRTPQVSSHNPTKKLPTSRCC